jgi:hypothetical protein
MVLRQSQLIIMEINTERIENIRARCAAARPGPWSAIIEGRDQTSGSSFIMIGEGQEREEDLYLTGDDQPVSVADYDFIANSRQDIPFLLTEIDRLSRLLGSKST